jgi:flagellar operon protein (TIGR03826 family)
MPDVRNCRRCGRIYNYIGGAPICAECKQLDEEDFQRVKKYLYENPGASLSQVSNVLEISVQKIKTFLKEGRLEIVGEEGNMILSCEKCGKSIRTGRFCDECERELARDLQDTARKMNDSLSSASSRRRSDLRYLHKDYGNK